MSRKVRTDGKADNRTGASGNGFLPVRWLNIRLDGVQAEHLTELLTTDWDFGSLALKAVAEGADLRIKRDANSNNFTAMYFWSGIDGSGTVRGLSAFSPDVRDALACLVYKWSVVLGEEHPDPEALGNDSPTRFR